MPSHQPIRRLIDRPGASQDNWSARRINAVQAAFPDMTRYLEIGLDKGMTLESVALQMRIGVDPHPKFDVGHLPEGVSVHAEPSNAYFRKLPRETQFDVVFVDGLHHYRQTYCDLMHALDHCSNGVVLVDDTVPSDAISAMRNQKRSLELRRKHGIPDLSWHGDVFKMMGILRDHHQDLDWVTVIDRDNPQTFVWRTGPPIQPIRWWTMTGYGQWTFEEVFESGVPEYFHPAQEDDALAQVIAALRTIRSS